MLKDRRESFYREHLHQGAAYPGFDLAASEITVNLTHTYDLLYSRLSRVLAAHGLSKSSLNILLVLRHGAPEGLLLHDLGELLLVSRANITGLIDHLEKRGMVRRVVDARDRRARFAQITNKGETLLEEYMPMHYRCVRQLLRGLSGEEKTSLVALLRKARQSIGAEPANGETEDKVA